MYDQNNPGTGGQTHVTDMPTIQVIESAARPDMGPKLPIEPGTQTSPAPVSIIGTVYPGAANFSTRRVPPEFTLQLENLTGGTLTYVIFDAYGFTVAGLGGGIPPTAGSALVAGITDSTIGNPFLIKGFNYEITVGGVGQFNERFDLLVGDLDRNNVETFPNILTSARRNNQTITTLQTYSTPFYIDGYSAIVVDVRATTTVELTFWVHTIFNRPV